MILYGQTTVFFTSMIKIKNGGACRLRMDTWHDVHVTPMCAALFCYFPAKSLQEIIDSDLNQCSVCTVPSQNHRFNTCLLILRILLSSFSFCPELQFSFVSDFFFHLCIHGYSRYMFLAIPITIWCHKLESDFSFLSPIKVNYQKKRIELANE